MSRPAGHLKARQQGATTLLVVSALALVMAVMSLTTSTVGTMEQRIVGNDMRAREAQEAAQAGLEFGIAWAGKNNLPWLTGQDTLSTSDSTTWLTLPIISGSGTGESYSIELIFSRSIADSDLIGIRSTSRGTSDSSITAIVEAVISPLNILSERGKSAPPLVMGGCMTRTKVTPEIFPRWTDLDGDGERDRNEIGVAIATSQSRENSSDGICLNLCDNTNDSDDEDDEDEDEDGYNMTRNVKGEDRKSRSTCDPEQPHRNLNHGRFKHNIVWPRYPERPPSLWNYFFSISQNDFRAYASTTLNKTGGLYWVNDEVDIKGVYGTVEKPVVIVVEKGCPKPKNSTTINGILFYLEESNCNMNASGDNITLNGSMGLVGGIKNMAGYFKFYDSGADGRGGIINVPPIAARQLPGTWRDFTD